jgi:pimeloyl-ACP methyl ester carboxylesterase
MSGGTAAGSPPSRWLDLALVLGVLPVGMAAWRMTKEAWLVYHPPRKPVRKTPMTFGMDAERTTVEGADGLPIACWFIPAPRPSDVVVVLGHGLGGNSGTVMPLARTLHDAGYHVLAFDLRNHGDTPDDGLLRGQSPRYGTDHHRVVLSLKERPELGDFRVACVGLSMSAWTSLEVARLEPDLVRAVVCDSGPQLDLVGALGRTFDVIRGTLPRYLQGPVMSAIARYSYQRAARFFLRPAPWPRDLGDHSIRVLFIAGELDPIDRPDDVRAQLDHYPKAEVWFVPRCGHVQAHVLAADEYGKRVLDHLAEVFGPRP